MSDDGKDKREKAGGVKHDARGNAVWQWAADTGRHAIDSTSRLLKRLEVPGLKIADDKAKPEGRQADDAAPLGIARDERDRRPKGPDAGGGYDPYGGMGGRAAKAGPSRPSAKSAPTKSAPATKSAPPVKPPAAAPGSRPSLWQRLTGKG